MEEAFTPGGPDSFSAALGKLTSVSASLGFSTETIPFFRDDVTSMFGPVVEDRARTGIVSQQASGCPVGERERGVGGFSPEQKLQRHQRAANASGYSSCNRMLRMEILSKFFFF